MKKFILFIAALFVFNFVSAQQKGIIKGKVIDTITGEPVQSAVVMDIQTGSKAFTGENGNFVLHSAKADSILIAFVGYTSKRVKAVYENTMLIALDKGVTILKDVIITNTETLDTYKTLTGLDLNMQPARSAQDLLRLVPGLFIAQHQGGGKAEQIFLRGFDADHGTDVNLSVDGIPVNMVSHAHGQGYADLHFLIPETVSCYDFGKGPYYTGKGDFTTAGYVAYYTKNVLDQDEIKVEAGQFQTLRVLAMINLLTDKARKKGQSAYIAAERLYSNGGPFALPEHFTRYNVFSKFTAKLDSNNRLTAIVSTLKSDWRASGETPDRAVSEGYIANRFGSLDSAQGGHTDRTNVSLKLNTILPGNWTMENQLYYSHYFFNLVSNFSFYYYFPATGMSSVNTREGIWVVTTVKFRKRQQLAILLLPLPQAQAPGTTT